MARDRELSKILRPFYADEEAARWHAAQEDYCILRRAYAAQVVPYGNLSHEAFNALVEGLEYGITHHNQAHVERHGFVYPLLRTAIEWVFKMKPELFDPLMNTVSTSCADMPITEWTAFSENLPKKYWHRPDYVPYPHELK